MATISFTTKFDLSLSPKQFVFTDNSDYAGQGISTSDVNGCFTIIAPSGATIYNNTDFSNANCDIRVGVSTTDQQVIPLPIMSDGTVEVGIYTIVYSVYNSNTAETYTKTVTVNNQYVAPVIDIEFDVNVISQIFSQTDETNYVVNGITPTLVRENKLTYPAGVAGGPPSPVITSSATLRTTTFFNGPQTATITSEVTYTFTDGLVVYDELFGSKFIVVDGSYYCSLACGIKTLERKTRTCNDTKLKAIYKAQFEEVMSYVAFIRMMIECGGGSGTEINQAMEAIKDIVGDCDCGCDDDAFSRITGWGTVIGADGADGSDGVDGTDGTDGTDGIGLLANNTTVDTPTNGSGSYQTLGTKTYTLPAAELANGDAIEISGWVSAAGTNAAHNAKLRINSTDIFAYGAGGLALPSYSFKILLTRISATSFLYDYNCKIFSTVNTSAAEWSLTGTVAANNMDTLTNVFSVQGQSPAGTTMQCKYLMVKLLKLQ